MTQQYNFKIVLIGDGGVGKTTFINRHKTGQFEKKYDPTVGVQITPLTFNLNNNRVVTLNIWDCSGQEKFSDLRHAYWINAQGLILMFDVTSKSSYKNIPFHHNLFKKMIGEIPTVLCGSKVDCKERKVKHTEKDIPYYDISSKSNYNFEEPFICLIRKLIGDSEACIC